MQQEPGTNLIEVLVNGMTEELFGVVLLFALVIATPIRFPIVASSSMKNRFQQTKPFHLNPYHPASVSTVALCNF